MNTILDSLQQFWQYTGFANCTWQHLVMILIGLIFITLGIVKKWEPLLLVPIGFGMIVGNIPLFFDPSTGAGLRIGIYEEGSVLNILYHHNRPPAAIAAASFPLMDALFPRDLGAVRADVLGRIPHADLADVRSLAKAIRHEERAERPLRAAVCASLFSTLLLLLARAATPLFPPASPIQQELDFISRNIDGKITVKDLCAVSGRSERTLFREFQKATGRTPCDYILALRAAKAEALLSQRGMTLMKAASLTGFCTGSHLSRTLRAHRR